MTVFSLDIANYRGVRSAEIALGAGLWCLVGPNGAGKTTLIKSVRMLRHAHRHGLLEALRHNGGLRAVSHLKPHGTDVEFSLAHEASGVRWQVALPLPFESPPRTAAESVWIGDELIVTREAGGQNHLRGKPIFTPDDERMGLRAAYDTGRAPELAPFIAWLEDYRYYGDYDEHAAQQPQAAASDDHLHPSGGNVAIVLRNWHGGRPAIARRFQFVEQSLRAAFPDVFQSLFFEPASDLVFAEWISGLDLDRALPLAAASRGMRRALLHLTAVAGASSGSVVAIDDFEDALHPHAIRSVIDSIRERAHAETLTVAIATQSPVVMNAFQEEPERVLVCAPDGPKPVTEHRAGCAVPRRTRPAGRPRARAHLISPLGSTP